MSQRNKQPGPLDDSSMPAVTVQSVTTPDALIEARTAIECGDWQRALLLLDALGPAATTAAGLEMRAQACYGTGSFEAAVDAWEQLHALFLADGDLDEAARAAAMVAMYLMMDTGLMAAVRGWLRRAERLLETRNETPAHALIAMVCTYERFMCGDMEAARRHAGDSIDLGERLGVQPAAVIGRVAFARTEIHAGNVDRGLSLLDEVGALLMSGTVDPLTTGMMYCELICAAQGLGRFELAREWTEVMQHWRHGTAFGGINGRCRVHRAELLRIAGPCDEAEEEALAACEELRPWMRREYGWPLVELGNIRLRKGDLAGAEEAYLSAHAHAWCPHPGLARVRLEQGDIATASDLIADAIAHPVDFPSKEHPPFGDLRLAPLFDAQAEIAAAARDAETTRRAAEALCAIADTYGSPALVASASLATARAALVEGHLDLAIDRSGSAVAAWSVLGAPFEAAVARMVLGEAHAADHSAELARMEWRAARTAFEEFGAATWVERADGLLAEAHPLPPFRAEPDETVASPATFTLEGDTRRVCFAGLTVLLRDLKGLRYLARLLHEPGREFHVLDIVAVDNGTIPVGAVRHVAELSGEAGGGLPIIDDQARESYRRRLADVEDDIEDAESMNDIGRVALARRDRDYLIGELARAVGLGGRGRTAGSDSERARTSVARSIRYAISRVAEHHPMLATHLDHAVQTGTYCSYTPDPLARVRWEVTLTTGTGAGGLRS